MKTNLPFLLRDDPFSRWGGAGFHFINHDQRMPEVTEGSDTEDTIHHLTPFVYLTKYPPKRKEIARCIRDVDEFD